jgi:hypothetical protein
VAGQPHSPAASTPGLFIWYEFSLFPYRRQMCLTILMEQGVTEENYIASRIMRTGRVKNVYTSLGGNFERRNINIWRFRYIGV